MGRAADRKCAVCHKKKRKKPLLNCAKCKVRTYCGADCQESDWRKHKPRCQAPNYILKVTLWPDKIMNPSITRTLSCPAFSSFYKLQKALNISFGWNSTDDSTSEFEFAVQSSKHCVTKHLLTIVEDNHEFDPDPDVPALTCIAGAPVVTASNITIAEVLGKHKYEGAIIEYDYDFSAWKHTIVLVGLATATYQFSCICGEGHDAVEARAEDVDGLQGWDELKEAYRAAVPTMEQRELKHWYETIASKKDPQGLGGGREWVWDQDGVNRALSRL